MPTNVYLGRNGNWADVSNWALGAIPIDADDVVIPDTTQTALTTNLDRTGDSAGNGLDLNSFYVHEGYHSNIGSLGNPLKCTIDGGGTGEHAIMHRGSGSFYYNAETGAANNTGTILIRSRNMTDAFVLGGDRGVHRMFAQGGHVTITSAFSGTLAWLMVTEAFGPVIVQALDSAAAVTNFFTDSGATTISRPSTDVLIAGGVVTQEGRLFNKVYQAGGLYLFNSGAATGIGTFILQSGVCDTRRTATAKAIAALYRFPSATLYRSPQLAITLEYDAGEED